jgi:hypothetical protein
VCRARRDRSRAGERLAVVSAPSTTFAQRARGKLSSEDEGRSLRRRCSRSFGAIRRGAAGVARGLVGLQLREILLTVVLTGRVIVVVRDLIGLIGRHYEHGSADLRCLIGREAGIGSTLRRSGLLGLPDRYSGQPDGFQVAVLILTPRKTSGERATADRHDNEYGRSRAHANKPHSGGPF